MSTTVQKRMTDEQAARLERALAHIRKHPETHDQAAWFGLAQYWRNRHSFGGCERKSRMKVQQVDCGSKACLAGHIAVQNGYVFVLDPFETTTGNVALKGDRIHDVYEQCRDAGEVAAELLGGTLHDDGEGEEDYLWNELFDGNNTLDGLHGMAYLLTDGRTTLTDDGLEWLREQASWTTSDVAEDWYNRHSRPLTELVAELEASV